MELEEADIKGKSKSLFQKYVKSIDELLKKLSTLLVIDLFLAN
jgi:hypothetical protein